MKRKRTKLLSAALLSFGMLFVAGAQSQSFATTFNVMHNFGGTDGYFPQATLAMDGSGNFYGTAWIGGTGSEGVVYELSPSGTGWTQTILWNFCAGGGSCADGSQPTAPVIVDTSGNLYGTTSTGGANGKGTVFKLTHTGSTWSESVLYSFGATASDGAAPMSRLTYAGASSGALYPGTGALYGTTNAGGSGMFAVGTVYSLKKVSGVWTETVLYNFCSVNTPSSCEDGAQPGAGGVTLDSSGHLYGIAGYGEFGSGLLYELIKTGGTWGQTRLYAFCPTLLTCTDGHFATGSNVIIDATGAIIGTMDAGGDYTNVSDGGGVIFKYSGGTEQVLYAFCQVWDSTSGECEDGHGPSQGGSLVLDSSGNLYGTTLLGGGPNPNDPGQAYRLDSSNGFHSLHKFCARTNCSDGEFPEGGLITDASGNLYGTAYNGGTGSQHGTVFQIIP